MKILVTSLLTVALVAACDADGVNELEFGKARLCVPSKYAAEVSPWLRTISPASVRSNKDVLIYIPAADVKAVIGAYTLSHPNQYTKAVPHEIFGVATSPAYTYSQGPETWVSAKTNPNFVVVRDADSGYWRVFEKGFDSLGWHLVTSPPNGATPPTGWYIGFCLGTLPEHHCSQRITVNDVSFDYDLDKSNLKVRREVESYLTRLFVQWGKACKT